MKHGSKFQYCYLNEDTGLMWCKFPNGTWAPPFSVGPKGSSDGIENVKTSSLFKQDDEADTDEIS